MTIHPYSVYVDWKKDKIEKMDFTECKSLAVAYYNTKEQNFWELPEISNLKSLKVTFTNVKNLDGLEKYPKLKELELYYCRNLNTFEGIEKISKDINFIQIDNAKKLTGYEYLKMLPNIETLRLNDDGPMENLNFIFDLPNLTSFSFVNTNVIDGNLTPLIEHDPMLEFVGFFDKRHYSHKSRYIEEYLGCYKESSVQTTIITLDNTDK